ncbi:MAG: hypothetical protein JRH01_14370 [Deltaproteobacteria bacterium]|nr:hypothetical protein [Deltaproteobacteria bacterium]
MTDENAVAAIDDDQEKTETAMQELSEGGIDNERRSIVSRAFRRSEMSKLGTLILAIGCSVAAAELAAAADFDGSRNLLCAPTDLVECGGAGECQRLTAEALNMPQFFTIDFKKKQMSGKLENGEMSTTAIQNVVKHEERTILQGAERGRGWSLAIKHATGEIAAAVAGDETSFVFFGACLPR